MTIFRFASQGALRTLILMGAVSSFTSASLAAVNDLTSWTLRFSSPESINVATTGCYATASYGYVLPTIEYLQAYRTSLLDTATQNNLNGFAFSSTKDANHDHVVLDLSTGELDTVPSVFNAAYKGLVFCQCRSDLTQARNRNGQPNCSRSQALRPLGKTFLATRDSSPTPNPHPQPADDWTDQVTGWKWQFAAVAANWNSAKTMCSGSYSLPDTAVLAHAAHRIWNSPLGLRIRDADARTVWSNEEFDSFKAMLVYIPYGDAGAENKRTLLPVLCVQH